MPVFEVTNEKGYWDGVHKHKPGTKVRIDPQDYERLLSVDMKPLDKQAKKDMEAFRRKCSTARRAVRDINGNIVFKNGQPQMEDVPIDIPQWQHTESGKLNPHRPEDLRKLTPRGAEVVEAPAEVEVEVVRQETSGPNE